MNWNESDIEVVRKVADEMWESEEVHTIPGWDPARLGDRERRIRAAAAAVCGSLNPDSGVPVSEKALGALLRYVVDILEQ